MILRSFSRCGSQLCSFKDTTYFSSCSCSVATGRKTTCFSSKLRTMRALRTKRPWAGGYRLSTLGAPPAKPKLFRLPITWVSRSADCGTGFRTEQVFGMLGMLPSVTNACIWIYTGHSDAREAIVSLIFVFSSRSVHVSVRFPRLDGLTGILVHYPCRTCPAPLSKEYSICISVIFSCMPYTL